MTIQEAIKSGKKFKRKHEGWNNSRSSLFTTMDILADDWEVEQTKKELSAKDIRNAYVEANVKRIQESSFVSPHGTCSHCEYLIKELGL